jgi:hypothetical protein
MGVRRTSVRLGVVMSAVVATAMPLPSCVDYFVIQGHLKDNPMDQAIATGDEFVHLRETRDRLLKRFPIGRPIVEVRRYLESVGASCRRRGPNDATIDCEYRQKEDTVLRTPIGDFISIRSLYDFRISLAESRQRLSEIRVCQRITRIYYEEPSDKPVRSRTYPFECKIDPNLK